MFLSYIPDLRLQPFISSYRIIESGAGQVNRVLPGTAPAISFRLNGQTSYISDGKHTDLPHATVSGLRKTVRLISYQPCTAMLIVQFREAGTAAFFRQPLHELFEETLPLDLFFPHSEVAITEEKLAAAADNRQRIAVVEQFLLSRLLHPRPDLLVTAAMENIHAAKGILRVKDLAGRLYISQDAFEKRFRKAAGTTPKQFASIVRMNAVIRSRQNDQSLFDSAFDGGYYDQPHFNKEFRLFTGLAPMAFFRSATFW